MSIDPIVKVRVKALQGPEYHLGLVWSSSGACWLKKSDSKKPRKIYCHSLATGLQVRIWVCLVLFVKSVSGIDTKFIEASLQVIVCEDLGDRLALFIQLPIIGYYRRRVMSKYTWSGP